MSRTRKEMLAKESEVQEWLGELSQLSQEAAVGSAAALYELRDMLAPDLEEQSLKFGMRELAEIVSPETLGTLYAASGLIEDLWYNFGKYTIGFPPEFIPTVSEIGRSLGKFIQAGAFEQDGSKGDVLVKLGEAVNFYHRLISETEERAGVEDGSGWITLQS